MRRNCFLHLQSSAHPRKTSILGILPSIMTSVTGLDFVAAWERKVIVDFGGEQVPVLCREDVLQSKIAAGRIRDRQDVQRLARPKS
jgi:hypothetical protein